LGIFQFPWGETSDSAVYQPAFNPALLAGPSLNAKLDARSHQLEPESEYSSSFFDDYDEEMDDDQDFESDDDFDETMLWEIASLLKSDNVPSKNSLLPPVREIVKDYNEDEETDFEEDEEDEFYQATKTAQFPVTKLPIMPLAMVSKEATGEESILLASGLATALETARTGLPQTEPAIWQADIPSAETAVRSKPLASQHLPVVASQEPSFMWTASTAKVEEHTSGLFSLDIRRLDFRTTHALPASSSVIRVPRISKASLPTLSSKSLWAPEQILNKESPAWTSTISIEAPPQTTWTPTPKVESIAILGLFSSFHVRSDYRTTSLLPVAQSMTIKSRSSHAPLPQLTSTSLWSGYNKLPFEPHWISESSTRPTSPSVFSESSSGDSSPVSETSSISGASLKSTSTNASSHWGSINGSTPIRWDTKGFGKSPNPPPVDNSKLPSKLPVEKGKGLEPVRESRVLASRDMWESRAFTELGEAPKRSFTVRKSITPALQMQETVEHEPLRQKIRCPVASKADWDAALAETIAAGTPKKTLSRPVVTEADWEAALQEAVSKTEKRLQPSKATAEMWRTALEEAIAKSTIPDVIASPRYDTAVGHPLSFTESLLSTASEIYPTATRDVDINVTPYDPAVLHPVFFTSSLVTSATDIHPAAIGRITRPQLKSLWKASLSHVATLESPVGPMWLKGKVAAPQFEHDKTATIRKAVFSRSTLLQRLESTNVWQPSQQALLAERNWILSAKRSRSQTWTPPKKVAEEDNIAMWAPKISVTFSLPDMAHHNGAQTKKSSAHLPMLAHLTSRELFTPTSAVSETRHWLHSTSTATHS
jgi:hypothetical protein